LIAAPKFNRKANQEFARALRQRVNQYFEDNNKKRTGDYRMAIKAIVMFSLYFGPYVLMATIHLPPALYLLCSTLMGIGVAGIGLAIMHDANHGSLSSKRWLNSALGYSLNLIGGNALSWKIQHNVLHHSFTNIRGLDEDLEAGNILRFTPDEPWKKRHRNQHIYAWFLYSFMTFSWVLLKDFVRLKKYQDRGLIQGQGVSYFGAFMTILVSKVFYIAYMLVLPIAVFGYSWPLVLGGFLIMHAIGGLMLAAIFQPAHILDEHEFVDSDEVKEIQDCYESHQLKTTSNFAPRNRILTWFVGGLNYQVEHHIFPSICHVHYPAISKIVRETAEEYNLPYRSIETFGGAISLHQRMLKKLSYPETTGVAA